MFGHSRSIKAVKVFGVRGRAVAVTTARIILFIMLVIPAQPAVAAEVAGGIVGMGMVEAEEFSGDIEALVENLESYPAEDAYDLSDLAGAPSDYDMIMNIPVQLENIHPDVDNFRINCWIGEVSAAGNSFEWNLFYRLERDIPEANFNGTIQLPLTIPPLGIVYGDPPASIAVSDFDWYFCMIYFHNQVNNQRRPVRSAIGTDVPSDLLWSYSNTEHLNLITFGSIE